MSFSDDVKVALGANAERFCREFLSAGKRAGTMWHVGSPENDAGDSLKVHLAGSRAGTGYYNRENKGIGPLDLFMRAKGIADFRQGLAAAAAWLGMREPVRGAGGGSVAKETRKFERVSLAKGPVERERGMPPRVDWKPVARGGRVWKYLVDERGIEPEALVQCRIGEGRYWMPKHNAEVDCWVAPAYAADGKELLMVKYLAVDRVDGDKDVRCNKGAEYHLLGLHLCPDAGAVERVVLCEGETDWLSCVSAGQVAVSVPFGAAADGEDGRENANNRWIANEWDWLSGANELVVAFDNDVAGARGAETVLRRLPERPIKRQCVLADTWADVPEKGDLNDLFQYDPLLLVQALANGREQMPEALGRPGDFRDKIYNRMFRVDGELAGYEVHELGAQFRWRLSEWTIITGYEKCGKTTWLGHQIIDLVSKGGKACIASLENQPFQTYETLFRQAMGMRRPVRMAGGEMVPDTAKFDRCVEWMDERVYCYRGVGFTQLEEVLELFAYTARRYGVRFFVIDSLMMLQVTLKGNQGATDREKEMAQLIKIFCDEHRAHVFLVAHAKKAQDDKGQFRKPVRPQDVRGAGELVNLAFNIVSVHLNDEKLYKMRDLWEAKRQLEEQAGGHFGPMELKQRDAINDEIAKYQQYCDSTFFVLGQRNAEGDHPKPARRLWFHADSCQLWHKHDMEPVKYVE